MPTPGPVQDRASRGLSIRTHLVLYGLALVLPLVAFSGILLNWFAAAEQRRYEAEAQQIVRQGAVAVDQSLAAAIATLQALATSPALQTGDFAGFYVQARRAIEASKTQIALRDLSGRQLVNTVVPWGAKLADVTEREGDREAIATGRPYVSDLTPSAVTRRPIVTVNVPVLIDGEPTYVLTMGITPAELQALIAPDDLPPGWTVGLVDRRGVFIARSRGHEDSVGRRAGEDVQRLSERSEGALERENVDGQRVLFAYARPKLAGWLVGIGISRDLIEAPVRRSLWLTAALGTAMLALSVALASLFGRGIARPVRELSLAAASLGRGEPVDPIHTRLREVGEVGRSLSAASIGLRERAAELAASEERYRLATEAFQGAVFDYDVRADRASRTPRHYELVGEEPGGFPETRAGWYDRIHPDDRAGFDAARNKLFDAGADGYESEYRVRRRDGAWIWVWHRARAMRDSRGRLIRVVGAILDVSERKRFEEHLRLLIDELNHRVKNTLATVQSIAYQTLRSAHSDADARRSFEARLLALSAAHDVLTRQNWESAEIRDVVQAALEPHRVERETRFRVEGPELRVEPRAALALAMALHELATNAAKYGALSTPDGTVRVAWSVEPGPDGRRATLEWIERGGPPVSPPTRKGFGSRLIERSLSGELGGEVRLAYDREGVACRVCWTLSRKM